MPQLGNTVEECIVTRWVRRKGDAVSTGDVVAEIETDKTTFEITAPVEGTVLATFFEEGALVPVFTNLFVIGNPGESVDAFRPQAGAAAATAAAGPPEPMRTGAPTPQPHSAGSTNPFSPRARKFAAEYDVHPASIIGSGPGGRVLERDVRQAYDAKSGLGTRDSGPVDANRLRTPDPEPLIPGVASSLRQTIARRMRESLASTAQYTLNSSADATSLLALRARVKATEGLGDITLNDLVTFCTIQALVDMPDLNAEFADGRIVTHSEVHLAFAVDTRRGLMAPVVRNAHKLSILELARRMKELTTRAVDGTIAADDVSGATFTISNLGSLGVESFTPLINSPQVAILGVGAIQLRPVRRSASARKATARLAGALAGAVEFVDSIGLSLTCDHQVIDGAPGARFLRVVREKIENIEKICKL